MGSSSVQGFVHLVADNGHEERFRVCWTAKPGDGTDDEGGYLPASVVVWVPGAVVPLVLEDVGGVFTRMVEYAITCGMLVHPPGSHGD